MIALTCESPFRKLELRIPGVIPALRVVLEVACDLADLPLAVLGEGNGTLAAATEVVVPGVGGIPDIPAKGELGY